MDAGTDGKSKKSVEAYYGSGLGQMVQSERFDNGAGHLCRDVE